MSSPPERRGDTTQGVTVDLDDMTVAQLRSRARGMKLTGLSGARKADLVSAIRTAEAETAELKAEAREETEALIAEAEAEAEAEEALAARMERERVEALIAEAEAEAEAEERRVTVGKVLWDRLCRRMNAFKAQNGGGAFTPRQLRRIRKAVNRSAATLRGVR